MRIADGRNADALDPVTRIWDELKAHLEQRGKELSAEVRRYPTPIAHCDDQLPKLIAQRDHALRQLRLMADVDSFASSARMVSLGALEAYLSASAGDPDDDFESAMRSRLAKEVAANRRQR